MDMDVILNNPVIPKLKKCNYYLTIKNKTMRRGTRILIGAAIAALTFGTLWATAGSRYYNSWKDGEHHSCSWHKDNDKAQNKVRDFTE